MTHAQDLLSKTTKRKSMNNVKSSSSLVSVPTASSRTNLSDSSSKETDVHFGWSQAFPAETLSLLNSSIAISTGKLELPISGAYDLGKKQSEIRLTGQSSSPQERNEFLSFPKQNENCDIAEQSSVIPDLTYPTNQDNSEDYLIISSDCTLKPPGSESPQLDQLLSELEEMKLKFRSDTPDPSLSESTDESLEGYQIYEFKDFLPEDKHLSGVNSILRENVPSAVQLAKDTSHANLSLTESSDLMSIQTEPEIVSFTPDWTENPETSIPSSRSCTAESLLFEEHADINHEVIESSLSPSFPIDIPHSRKFPENASDTFSSVSCPEVPAQIQFEMHEENQPILCEEDSAFDILQSQEELELALSTDDSRGATNDLSTKSVQDELTLLWKASSIDSTQSEDCSSQSLSEMAPETITHAEHFIFEKLLPFPSQRKLETFSNEHKPQTSTQFSEDSLTPTDSESFVSQSIFNQTKAKATSKDEYSVSPVSQKTSETSNQLDMPTAYAEVVLSRTGTPTLEYCDPELFFDCRQAASDLSETDEPNTDRIPGKVYRRGFLSSESEDYEDAAPVHEPFYYEQEEKKKLLLNSEETDEEFTLCKAVQLPHVAKTGAYDETDTCLSREITEELGSMSESSDDEFLTTRVVRRRVVIQADDMPDLPSQSVTEEKFKDENGHIVVKKVTRKIIRKCVSADGVEQEEVLVEGAPEGSINVAEGDGYSKVVKRTVLKSEGDHTEVTFAESEGFSSSKQDVAKGGKVRRTEKTTFVQGERTMTHKGDPSLASDLPSAKDDFKQALGYLSGFSRTGLPHVVERETVKEDGTVVWRAHMHKGRTFRRTVVKEAGQRKQVLLEQVENPRKGSKPHALQQHLYQLFYRYHQDEKENTDEDE